jgi:hypothetical protein
MQLEHGLPHNVDKTHSLQNCDIRNLRNHISNHPHGRGHLQAWLTDVGLEWFGLHRSTCMMALVRIVTTVGMKT